MKNSFPNLDGLRAIAILPVLGLHASYGLMRGGFLGVDLFFVLSGFLITWLLYQELQQTQTISFRNFYKRRALRLFPAMIVSIFLAAALWPLTSGPDSSLLMAVTSVLFYLADLIDPKFLGSLGATWSLSLEEQFYFVWPVLLLGMFICFRGKIRHMLYCLVGVVFLVIVFRGWMYLHCPLAVDLYRFPFSRVDSLAMGAIAALFLASRGGKVLIYKPILMVSFILSAYAMACFLCEPRSSTLLLGGYTIVAAMFACLILALSQMPPTRLFSNPLLIWIGRRSYGLYIYNLPIFWALEAARIPKSTSNLICITILRFLLTFLVAALSYRFLEKPFLNLKRQFTRPGIEGRISAIAASRHLEEAA